MNKTLSFADGHIEYWSTFSIGRGLVIFDCPKKALEFISATNDHFPRGYEFHKELNGTSLLASD